MNAHCRKDTRKGYWNKTQYANGIEARASALASMCLADNDLAGCQPRLGMLTSPSQDRMTTNPLSLYASFLGFQAQHAESGYNEPSSRHSELVCMTSPWKRRRLSLRRRPWCLSLPLLWALATVELCALSCKCLTCLPTTCFCCSGTVCYARPCQGDSHSIA
jgi:hypothetical protein